MSVPKLKVLISGGGIAGSCLAFWLAKTGLNISTTIVERAPSRRVSGQAVDIRGPAIDIIKKMKLEEAIRSRYTTEKGTRFINSSGKPFAEFASDHTFTAEFEILRADLADIFLEATENFDNVKYVYGDSIESLSQSEKDVSVAFKRGWKDTFDVVVAADGSTSRTRPLILDSHILKDSYKFLGWYIAYFSIPSRPNDDKMWNWYCKPKGLCIMTRPHRTNTTMGAYLSVTTPAKGRKDPILENAVDSSPLEQKRILREYFEDAGWEAKRVLDGMDQDQDFYMSRAALVKLPKWTNHRALVIGDAGFATQGVGTSLAIESAYVLAGELSKIRSSNDVPQALEKYEEIFRTLYNKMGDVPPGFPQMAFPQTRWGLWVRDLFLWFVTKTKVYKLFPNDESVDWEPPSYKWVGI
ncbi:hypothetical protein ACLMJK_009310 [Lecanora helva]